MKLKNIKEVEEFRKVIHACAGDVYLKSQDGDVFNLKSALSEYIALGQLLSEHRRFHTGILFFGNADTGDCGTKPETYRCGDERRCCQH